MQDPVQISIFDVMKENELSSEAVEKKLYKLLCECEAMCKKAGLQIGQVKEIYINKRLNSAWGRCVTKIKEGYSCIEINRKLLSEHVPESSLRNTILHELCHTVPNGSGHKKRVACCC
ncbi:MAG: SprT-like domain-containing protein [Anaerolineaceae bacterium]|nr:SprT-like domain-containing protein [Anaerolineaceae bacterium]